MNIDIKNNVLFININTILWYIKKILSIRNPEKMYHCLHKNIKRHNLFKIDNKFKTIFTNEKL